MRLGINQPADGDRNLVVNDLDYDYWRSRFGQTSGSSSSPEKWERTRAHCLRAMYYGFACWRL